MISNFLVAFYTVGGLVTSSSLTISLVATSLATSLLIGSLVSRLFGLVSVGVGLLVGQRLCWFMALLVSDLAVDGCIGSSS